jgi:hypothetical protein
MADIIKCPVCGENNSSDQEFCQYCQSPLRPASSSSKGADEGFKPGQAPTKKVTAELEPILPEWLRDARDSARNAVNNEDIPQPSQQSSQDSSRPAAPPDLLAGLQAQSENDEEEDLPDWLTSITGASPPSKKNQPDSPDVRWVELGGEKSASEKPAAETPSWLANLSSSTEPSAEKDELTNWMREASGIKPQESQPPSQPVPSETAD